MADQSCIDFLQWALPQLGLRWQGFRKVHRQICKRIKSHFNQLGLKDFVEYKSYITSYPDEWESVDSFCYISISRFYRDKLIFDMLTTEILPDIVRKLISNGENRLRCWCAGCCSGEEPYTLQIIWQLRVKPHIFAQMNFNILATDQNRVLLDRAEKGVYKESSLKHLPDHLKTKAFKQVGKEYLIYKNFKENIDFYQQDIRKELPEGNFHLVLCRNLVFTYFENDMQIDILKRIAKKILPGGFLIIGSHESLPSIYLNFSPYKGQKTIFQNRIFK
jgi:chemotaxis protein methyltransferase CheR